MIVDAHMSQFPLTSYSGWVDYNLVLHLFNHFLVDIPRLIILHNTTGTF